MTALFGKDIVRTFTVDDGTGTVALPEQEPTIYLFDTSPSVADGLAGTGALATVSAWDDVENSNSKVYVIPAITDEGDGEKDYYEAINYRLQDAGDFITKIRAFTVTGAQVTISEPGTTTDDVRDCWPKIDIYADDDEILNFLKTAEDALRNDLGASRWTKLSGLEGAKQVLAYKALEHFAVATRRRSGDKFDGLLQYFQAKYNDQLAKVELKIDTTGDGKPDEDVSAGQTIRLIQVGR